MEERLRNVVPLLGLRFVESSGLDRPPPVRHFLPKFKAHLAGIYASVPVMAFVGRYMASGDNGWELRWGGLVELAGDLPDVGLRAGPRLRACEDLPSGCRPLGISIRSPFEPETVLDPWSLMWLESHRQANVHVHISPEPSSQCGSWSCPRTLSLRCEHRGGRGPNRRSRRPTTSGSFPTCWPPPLGSLRRSLKDSNIGRATARPRADRLC
jgi:hypothetical protein